MTLPYEPVSFRWLTIGGSVMTRPCVWDWGVAVEETAGISASDWLGNDRCEVTLGNGQRIILKRKEPKE